MKKGKILLPAHFAEVEIIASPMTLVTTMEAFRPDVVLLDMNFYTDINTGNDGPLIDLVTREQARLDQLEQKIG